MDMANTMTTEKKWLVWVKWNFPVYGMPFPNGAKLEQTTKLEFFGPRKPTLEEIKTEAFEKGAKDNGFEVLFATYMDTLSEYPSLDEE